MQINYNHLMIMVPTLIKDISSNGIIKTFVFEENINAKIIENIHFIYHDFDNLYNIENNTYKIETPFSLAHFYDPQLSKIKEIPNAVPYNCIVYGLCKFLFFMLHQYENASKKIKVKFESLFNQETNDSNTSIENIENIENIIQFSNTQIQNAFVNTPLYDFLKHNISCKMEERRLFL